MRSQALSVLGLAAGLSLPCGALATDAEPLWLPPDAGPFTLLPSTDATPPRRLGFEVALTLRLRPALLQAPAPNREGRTVNALRLATDGAMAWSLGLGYGLEVQGATSLGLSQRGAGIKGVTSQDAPPLPSTATHDPRLGLAYAFGAPVSSFGAKLRLELKLPLGDADALNGEAGLVASPSLAVGWRPSHVDRPASGQALAPPGPMATLEVGARLRSQKDFFGARIGNQAFVAFGLGYALLRPRLTFTLEAYALPGLGGGATAAYLPSEWLSSVAFSPTTEPELSFGLAGGAGIPLSSDSSGESYAAFGVPALRAHVFARFAPDAAQQATHRPVPR